MIAFFGDVHAKFRCWLERLATLPMDVRAVVQLGDLGVFPPGVLPELEQLPPLPRRVYWTDGNHEYFPAIAHLTEPTEVRPNLVYVPRGTVLTLDGRRVLFLGGAESVDRAWRVEGVSWFREERISYVDMERAADAVSRAGGVDLMATHTPPGFVIRQMLGVEPDGSARAVELVWDRVGRPPLFCGHLHVAAQILNVHVLPELGVALV